MKKLFIIIITISLTLITLFTGCGKKTDEKAEYIKGLNITKVEKYLYEIEYDDYDYSDGKALLEKYYPNFACSSVQIGDYRGRNYDWYYDESAEFIIRVSAKEGRHASIGVASSNSLNDDIVSSKKYHEVYKGLPCLTLDGINDAGLTVNVNVLPFNDGENAYSSMKTETTDDDICGIMLPRYLLDKAGNVEEAVEIIDGLDVYSLSTADEFHFMISGAKSSEDSSLQTVVVEFVPNTDGKYTTYVVGKLPAEYVDAPFIDDKMIMTNFLLKGFDGNTAKGNRATLTEHAMGIERYDILSENYTATADLMAENGNNPMTCMLNLMQKVNYSKAYDFNSDKYWYSEFSGQYREEIGNLTKDNIGEISLNGDLDKAGAYTTLLKNIIMPWKQANKRDSTLWITVHTSVYDVVNKKLLVVVQEGTNAHEYSL